MRKNKVSQMTLCAILISMALVLSYMERFIPLQMIVPLPGIKLGLANVVTLMALFFLGNIRITLEHDNNHTLLSCDDCPREGRFRCAARNRHRGFREDARQR